MQRRYAWRLNGGWYVGFAVAALLSIISTIRGESLWLAGFGLGFVGAFIWGWYASARQATRRAEAAGPIQITVSAESLVAATAGARTEFQWSSVRRVLRFPELWVLEAGFRTILPIPADVLDEETRKLIISSTKAAGGRVE